jgi:hypothetical protein
MYENSNQVHGEALNIMNKKIIMAISIIAISSLSSLAFTATATAATKSITCYKGTQSKIVKAASPKCPSGWSTKKPAASATAPTKAATGSSVSIDAKYSGTISMLWSDAGVTATGVKATSASNNADLDTLTGSGSSAPQSKCDIILGNGLLSGGGNSIKVTFDSSTKGCAEDEDGPTTVNITGTAIINGGTGKFAGATGTLKVTGSFGMKSHAAGASEKSDLKLSISGNIVTK